MYVCILHTNTHTNTYMHAYINTNTYTHTAEVVDEVRTIDSIICAFALAEHAVVLDKV